jgi:hypothetical protein
MALPAVPHPSLSHSLTSSDAPTAARAPTPPPSPQHAPVLGPPSPTVAARTPPRQRVPPPTFPSIFLLHAWPQHIRIYTANEARQSTHQGNIHFYHLPRKQARHIGNMHIPPACKAQANKYQQCTHTCTHTDSSCMHAKLGTDHQARLDTVHLHAKHLLATRRTAQASDHSVAIGDKQASQWHIPASWPIKRHAWLLFHSSTLSSPLTCLLSLHLPRVYRIRPYV